jgi:MerR family transcriptional regulator, mercuric resistance operon regulatory protein
MRIGAVAAASGVSVETLRFYERRGLLAPPARLPSGYREYLNDAVRVVRFIRHAQDLGFTLEDITGLLALAAGGPEGCDTVRDLAEAKIDTVTDKITRLVAIRDALAQLVATCERPRPDRTCPLLAEADSSLGGTT